MKINLLYCRKYKYAISLLAISLIIILGASPTRAQTACADDNTTADFTAGLTINTYVSDMNGGEVILKPAAAAEFSVLPPVEEWNSFAWQDGGGSTVSGGVLTVDGARFNTEPESLTFGPGDALDFVATFAAASFQHIGFGAGTDNTGSGGIYWGEHSWAMFSTGNNSTLQARTYNGTSSDVAIPGDFLGSPHHYRIEWISSSEFRYYIDGSLVYTELGVNITEPMRVAVSNFNLGDAVSVDWIHISPYANSGTFESRIFGGPTKTPWGTVAITASTPAGTSLSTDIRTGNTPTPDGSWTAYTPVSNGDNITGSSNYIQYRANLATTDQTVTSVLKSFSINDCFACRMQLSAAQTNISCHGAKNGSITITATKGAGLYQYKLGMNGTPQSEPTFSGLRAKPYKVYVTDANGCTKSVAVTLTEPAAITVTATKTDVTCQGGHDGSITVEANGEPGATYMYKKGVNGALQMSPVFSHLVARTFKIFAINENSGCTGFVNVTIADGPPCDGASSVADADDNLSSNGFNVKVSPNPAVSDFTLALNGSFKGNVEIKVTDMFGKAVYKTSGAADKLYRFGSELRAGVYILQVTQGSKSKTVKIIKQ